MSPRCPRGACGRRDRGAVLRPWDLEDEQTADRDPDELVTALLKLVERCEEQSGAGVELARDAHRVAQRVSAWPRPRLA